MQTYTHVTESCQILHAAVTYKMKWFNTFTTSLGESDQYAGM